MKCILFSEQIVDSKNPMNIDLAKFINKKGANVAYISSIRDESRKYFEATKNYYDSIGIKKITYFDLYDDYNESKVEKILNCDAIHLSGEDAQEFLKMMKEKNFKVIVDKFIKEDKPIIGVSGGSIVITESIEGIRFIGCDYDNEIGQALNLVNFEFIPHWGDYKSNLFKVIDYSAKKDKTIYCCKDGYGLILNNKDINFYGEITRIENGRVSLLNGNVRLY